MNLFIKIIKAKWIFTKPNKKNILITGGTGFFGKKFTYHFLKKYNPKNVLIHDSARPLITNLLIRKIIKNVKKKKIIFSTDEKIKLAKEYIFSLFIITIKNNYIENFIKNFFTFIIKKNMLYSSILVIFFKNDDFEFNQIFENAI